MSKNIQENKHIGISFNKAADLQFASSLTNVLQKFSRNFSGSYFLEHLSAALYELCVDKKH